MKKRAKRNSRKSVNRTKTKESKDRGHHITPRSRGGSDDPSNKYHWKENHQNKHPAWHNVFANLLPSEAILLIKQWTRKDGELDLRYFRARKDRINKRLFSWKTLFGDMTPAQAIEWIEREFIRKEWLPSGTPGVSPEEEVSS